MPSSLPEFVCLKEDSLVICCQQGMLELHGVLYVSCKLAYIGLES